MAQGILLKGSNQSDWVWKEFDSRRLMTLTKITELYQELLMAFGFNINENGHGMWTHRVRDGLQRRVHVT